MRASCFHSTGHFHTHSRLSRILCALSSRTLSSIMYKVNTGRTKMNLHRFESRTGISSSNFILVPSCEIRTAHASAGLLASEVFWVLLVHRKIGTSIRKKKFSVRDTVRDTVKPGLQPGCTRKDIQIRVETQLYYFWCTV